MSTPPPPAACPEGIGTRPLPTYIPPLPCLYLQCYITFRISNRGGVAAPWPSQKVIGYTRVSTAEQVEGFGLDVQESKIRAYCKAEGLQSRALLSPTKGSRALMAWTTDSGLAEALARIEKDEAQGTSGLPTDPTSHGTCCSRRRSMHDWRPEGRPC